MENWIAKYLINTEALLQIGETKVGECIYKVASINGLNFFGHIETIDNFRLIEIIFEKKETDSIEDAYIKGQDFIDEFIDRFCFISYSSAIVNQCVSVSKESVKLNEEFEIIYVHYFKQRKLNNIDLNKIDFQLNDQQKRYLRLLRSGILATNFEEKLLNFFTVLEQIALEESKETIKNTCSNCGNENDTGNKKTNNYIKQILEKFSFTSSDVKKITEYRGKIAHGGGKRNQKYYLDVNKYAIQLEGPVYNLVLERISESKIQNDCNPHILGYPFMKAKFKFINKEFELEFGGWKFTAEMQPSVIDNAEKKSGLSVGVHLNENNQLPLPQRFELPTLIT